MSYVTIEDRVDRLEALFGQFMTEMAVLNKRAEERQCVARQPTLPFAEEMRASRREMKRTWWKMANKMGTIIEDILAPNLRSCSIGSASRFASQTRLYRVKGKRPTSGTLIMTAGRVFWIFAPAPAWKATSQTSPRVPLAMVQRGFSIFDDHFRVLPVQNFSLRACVARMRRLLPDSGDKPMVYRATTERCPPCTMPSDAISSLLAYSAYSAV